MYDYRIMDVTTGDLAGGWFETYEDAREWVENQDNPNKYEIFKG